MTTRTFIDDMASKLAEMMANSPAADFEKNARALMASMLAKANLVTREEFDAQMRVLQRTREKLAELEKRLDAYDKK
jgi:BMFP domain-containing protein YqiC